MDNKFTPLTDEQMKVKIKNFGLFDGKNEAVFYAHLLPNAIDPEDMYSDNKVKLYFELFNDSIIKTIQEKSFYFKYSAILEFNDDSFKEYYNTPNCFDNSDKELYDMVLKKAENVSQRVEMIKKNNISYFDIIIKLKPVPLTENNEKIDDQNGIIHRKCKVMFSAPVSEKSLVDSGIPLYLDGEFEINESFYKEYNDTEEYDNNGNLIPQPTHYIEEYINKAVIEG